MQEQGHRYFLSFLLLPSAPAELLGLFVANQKLHGETSAGIFGGTVSRNLICFRRMSATTASTCSGVKPTPA